MSTWMLYSFVILGVVAAALIAHILLRRSRLQVGLPWHVWPVLAAVLLFGISAAEQRATIEQRRIESALVGMGPTYADELVSQGLLKVKLDTPPDDPVYLHLIERQKRYLALNHMLADIYVMIRDDKGDIRLLVDSETDYDHNGVFEGEREQRTQIGEVYESPSGELVAAFDSGRAGFEPEPYTDRWGTWVSANTPIKDNNGQVVAVLGLDYDAASWTGASNAARYGVLGLCVALSGILIAGYGVTTSLRASLRKETELAEARLAREVAANAASEAKSAFLAHVSHEIRTPVSAIVGYADLLMEGGLSPGQQTQHLSTIARNGQHLLSIINDILDLASIDRDRLALHIEPVEPVALVAEIGSLFDGRARSRSLALDFDVHFPLPETVDVDPVRLRQILVNIVGNAIKFTESGTVKIRVHTDLLGNLHIRVIDSGVGIRPDQIPRLFGAFVQGDAGMDRRFGGTGLGLAISRKLARQMGGDISVESAVGSGSIFSIRLPIKHGCPMVHALPELVCSIEGEQVSTIAAPISALPSQPQTSPAAPIASAPVAPTGGSFRVLLAEDGIDNQRLLNFHLQKLNASVVNVVNGADAVAQVTGTSEPFDLILMDMQMPVMDGYEATRRLRAAGCRTPIVALTAHAGPDDRRLCLDAGCDEYCLKPIDRARLAQLLQSLTSHHAAA